jgi:hypothetical protein
MNAQTSSSLPEKISSELLRRLARKTLQPAYVGSVGGSDIYQISQSWQREVLLGDSDVTITHNTTEFENAVQSANFQAIFVPYDAALTQEVAERILLRNPLSKTIFWEITV